MLLVVKNRDRDVLKYLDILRNKKEALQVRFNKIEEIYNVEVNKLYIIDKKLAKEALAVVNEFFRRTLFK